MSLMYYAHPIINDNPKKNKTEKKTKFADDTDYYNKKVKGMMNIISKTEEKIDPKFLNVFKNGMIDDSGSDLENFKPMEPPMSMGTENTKIRDMGTLSGYQDSKTFGNLHNYENTSDDEDDMINENGGGNSIDSSFINTKRGCISNSRANKQCNMYNKTYKNVRNVQPVEETIFNPYSNFVRDEEPPKQPERYVSNKSLVDKINYMIHLLENQQYQKTNNVTEEVLLYAFLGIFIIFVINGCSYLEKYKR